MKDYEAIIAALAMRIDDLVSRMTDENRLEIEAQIDALQNEIYATEDEQAITEGWTDEEIAAYFK